MADLLSIARSGLGASKQALETTAHNVANANTEGYSRQRVSQTTNIPTSKQGLIQGTGVRVSGINRISDIHLVKKLRIATTNESFYQEKNLQLEQVENIFNEINHDGLNKVLNKFYNSFRELANQPENETIRSIVREDARLVAKDFRRIRKQLDDTAVSIDKKLEGRVKDINTTTKTIARLNRTIQEMEASGNETGDLRDQRDRLLLKLSEDFQIHTYESNKGIFTVHAVGVGTLVSATQMQELAVKGTPKENSSNNMDGSYELYFTSDPQTKVSTNFKKGKLQALFDTRNEDVRNLQDNLDKIAYHFINTTNAIHRRGYVSRKIPMNEQGVPMYDQKGKTTGIDFFKTPMGIDNAASYIDLSDDIKDDLSNIATAFEPNKAGDNRIALAISKLQHEKMLGDGTTTLEEEFLKVVGQVGLSAGKAKIDAEQSEGILAQTKSIKERVSGVSIDEETSNLMKFQHAYQASAKVMQAGEEMFQTVINIKK